MKFQPGNGLITGRWFRLITVSRVQRSREAVLMRRIRPIALGISGLLATTAVALAAPAAQTGPSSSQSPYLVRAQPGVVTKSILTVGDSVNIKPDGTPRTGWSGSRTASARSTTATGRSRC